MRRALLRFGRDTRGADMAVIYFAGHGIEIGGENWLIPIDAELRSDSDVEGEAISLKAAMFQVANAASLGLVFLDSCRNNPFAVQMKRPSRPRAVDRGLTRVEPTDNVLVAYAAKDGTVASDGNGRNSPFTAALLSNLEIPGIEIRFLLASVRDDVLAATDRQQQPFVYGSLSRQSIYLKPPHPGALIQSEPLLPSEAAQAWAVTKDTTSIAVLTDFIRLFGNTPYASMASARLDELRRNGFGSIAPLPPVLKNPLPEIRPASAGPCETLPANQIGEFWGAPCSPINQVVAVPPSPPTEGSSPAKRPAAAAPSASSSGDEPAWLSIKGSLNVDLFRRFIRQFPNSSHRSDAEQHIRKIANLLPDRPPGGGATATPSGGIRSAKASAQLQKDPSRGSEVRWAPRAGGKHCFIFNGQQVCD